MTGRRLYDLLCDAWVKEYRSSRLEAPNLLRLEPLAWPFLTPAERRTLNEAARRATMKRRP